MAQRTQGDRAGLSRAMVLEAALALVDNAGLAALSMRRLAASLGVEAMTLYYYLPNKDALLDGLVERIFEDAATPIAGGRAWDDALKAYAIALRAALLKHPNLLAVALSRPATTPQTLRTVEEGLGGLCAAGFALGRAVDVLNTLTVFVVGHAVAEVATGAVNARGAAGSSGQLALLDPLQFPLIAAAAVSGRGTDDAQRFAFGLTALLTGFRSALAEPDT